MKHASASARARPCKRRMFESSVAPFSVARGDSIKMAGGADGADAGRTSALFGLQNSAPQVTAVFEIDRAAGEDALCRAAAVAITCLTIITTPELMKENRPSPPRRKDIQQNA